MEGRAGSASAVKLIQYRLCELEAATDGFSPQNLLGDGAFGSVYKGQLTRQTVAIKKIRGDSVNQLLDIAKEAALLHSLAHDNVVKLLGFCSENGNYLLVYEYIPNGDLRSNLQDEEKRKRLDWKRRLNIMKGIASGLSYLHDLRNPIVHRDIKPANVLLDADYNAVVADFGISKIFNINKTHNTTQYRAGTPGYFAPELWHELRFSPKSDVYSFGLLILELIVGCTIPQYASRTEKVLPHVIWDEYWKNSGPLEDFVDQDIWDKRYSKQINHCIGIALQCIQNDYKKRPKMKIVLRCLRGSSECLDDRPSFPGFYPASSSATGTRSSSLEREERRSQPQQLRIEDSSSSIEPRSIKDEKASIKSKMVPPQKKSEYIVPESSSRQLKFQPVEAGMSVQLQHKKSDKPTGYSEFQSAEPVKSPIELQHAVPTNSSSFIEVQPTDTYIEFQPTNTVKLYSLQALESATNKFSSKFYEDAICSKYLGTIDGQKVVVEKCTLHRDQSDSVPAKGNYFGIFLKKEKLLKLFPSTKENSSRDILLPNIRHPNIINIMGYCLEVPSKLCVVSQYSAYRNLQDYLFASRHVDGKWGDRERIIKGIANGISFLHCVSQQNYLIHGNLNPYHIWLDDSGNVKLSSFLCTRVLNKNEKFIELSKPCGRVGYIAPEIYSELHLSTKSDVYSYGIIMLEILVRKKVVEHQETDFNLFFKVWNNWQQKKMLELLDPDLTDHTPEKALRYFQIGLLCIQEDPNQRPNMEKVVRMLNSNEVLPIPVPPPSFCAREG